MDGSCFRGGRRQAPCIMIKRKRDSQILGTCGDRRRRNDNKKEKGGVRQEAVG